MPDVECGAGGPGPGKLNTTLTYVIRGFRSCNLCTKIFISVGIGSREWSSKRGLHVRPQSQETSEKAHEKLNRIYSSPPPREFEIQNCWPLGVSGCDGWVRRQLSASPPTTHLPPHPTTGVVVAVVNQKMNAHQLKIPKSSNRPFPSI